MVDGTLVERVLMIEDLAQADQLAVLNSLRGWPPARLLPRQSGQ